MTQLDPFIGQPATSTLCSGNSSETALPVSVSAEWRTELEVSRAMTSRAGSTCDDAGASSTLDGRPQNYSNGAILAAIVRATSEWGDQAPGERAIDNAHRLIDRLAMAVALKKSVWPNVWTNPHVPPSMGEVVFEWWRGRRKLTIDVGNDSIEFTKVWGPNIETEMKCGAVGESLEDLQELWAWLLTS